MLDPFLDKLNCKEEIKCRFCKATGRAGNGGFSIEHICMNKTHWVKTTKSPTSWWLHMCNCDYSSSRTWAERKELFFLLWQQRVVMWITVIVVKWSNYKSVFPWGLHWTLKAHFKGIVWNSYDYFRVVVPLLLDIVFIIW